MMTKLKKAVEQLVKNEYALASEQHGERFHSPHEAYAVILEELEEAKVCIDFINENMSEFWQTVMRNSNGIYSLEQIFIGATECASECIQVAAMAHKAMQGYEQEGEQ